LARITGKTSRLGHLYDLGSDAVVTIAVFVAIGVGIEDPPGKILDVSTLDGAIVGGAVALIFFLRMRIEEMAGKSATRQGSLVGFETEDALYLVPLITLFHGLEAMLVVASVVAPLYVLASNLGWLDTYRVLILVYLALGLPFVIWVLFGHFRTIPTTLDEAARIDGAGPLTIFFRIIVPIALPGIVTTGLLSFIAAWNEFMFALAFTSDIERQTVPVGIANFTDLHYVPWGDIAAASVVVTFPLVALVLIFQRNIISGITGGAVKE